MSLVSKASKISSEDVKDLSQISFRQLHPYYSPSDSPVYALVILATLTNHYSISYITLSLQAKNIILPLSFLSRTDCWCPNPSCSCMDAAR